MGGRRSWTLAFASCSRRSRGRSRHTEGPGDSNASHSLIKEQQGGHLTCGAWGAMNTKMNSQRPRKRVWMPQDPFTPGKTEREAGRECQWLWHTLFSAREDNGVASWFTTVALTHIVIRFCMQYQNQPLERRKNWKSLVLPSLFMQLGEVSCSYNAECLQHSSLAEAIVTAP